MYTLFIFRRDLRVNDNTGLNHALSLGHPVIACFIFDPRQTKKHDYFSSYGFTFLLESLKDLEEQLRKEGGILNIVEGFPHEIIEKINKLHPLKHVVINQDYTPFSALRDKQIHEACKKNNISFHTNHDALLTPPGSVLKSNKEPYTIFTPFWKAASLIDISQPKEIQKINPFLNQPVKIHDDKIIESFLKNSPRSTYKGGTHEAKKILDSLQQFTNYENERNIPSIQGTTLLSPHNKFGTVSIRETYYSVLKKLGNESGLIRELYWRDFFTHIAYHFPHIYGNAFNKKYNSISWENNNELLDAWKKGQTGFPIVDAGMRELKHTGYMHNRVRMIVASFLTKDLLIDWREGEKHFAQYLIDYDPAVNNGNWQWAASTGCDAQPYFRIFNPWLQQQKFDPECIYIKKWIPELKNVSPKAIHNTINQSIIGYQKPIVEHSEQSKTARALFEKSK